jgi:predicted CXXCH cytochrome family protein
MGEIKESKRIASRIDIRYIDRPNWFQWWRRWLVLSTLVGMLFWTGWMIHSTNRGGSAERLLNPGPVTAAHARFENACSTCHGLHNGSPASGSFSKVVADEACLHCHDAGAHHPLADLHPGQSDAIHLTNRNSPTKAANCVTCHIEHRGHETLVGRDSRLCLQCHQELSAHIASIMTAGFPDTVTGFPANHPEFGRRLVSQGIVLPGAKSPATLPSMQPATSRTAQPSWLPNLAIKFNHRTHIGPESLAKIQSCASCHSTSVPSPANDVVLAQERQSPPQPELSEQSGFSGVRPGGEMQPIRYELHCRGCHALGLPITPDLKVTTLTLASKRPTTKTSVPAIVHGPIELVLAQLADVDRLYLDLLVKVPDGQSLLVDPKTHKRRSIADWLAQQRMELAARLVADGSKEFFPADFQKLAKAQTKLAIEMKKKKPSQDTLDDLNDEIDKALPKAKESILNLPASSFQAACEKALASLNSEGNCAKCHITEGQVMDAAQWMTALEKPGEKPFATLPTGIGSQPRHWFAGARFNHDKHRDMACLDCHAGMDQDEDGLVKNATGEVVMRQVLRMPGVGNCATCHTPDTAASRGAGDACVTCHVFHDRSKERDAGVSFGVR